MFQTYVFTQCRNGLGPANTDCDILKGRQCMVALKNAPVLALLKSAICQLRDEKREFIPKRSNVTNNRKNKSRKKIKKV